MAKSQTTDEGSLQPDNTFNDDHNGLEIDVSSKRRNSMTDYSEDSQTSPPVNKKARIFCSLVDDDVLSTVKKAVMGGTTTKSEKQQQISQMIAELQSLQQNLDAEQQLDSKVRSNDC